MGTACLSIVFKSVPKYKIYFIFALYKIDLR